MTNHTESNCYQLVGYLQGDRHQHSANNRALNSNFNQGTTQSYSTYNYCTTVVNNAEMVTLNQGPTMPAFRPSAAFTPMPTTSKASELLIDSSAAMHIRNTREWFAEFQPHSTKKVILGDGGVTPVMGHERIEMTLTFDGRTSVGSFNDVLFVPTISVNILLVSSMTKAGLQLSFCGDHCNINSEQGAPLARVHRETTGDLYRIFIEPRHQQTFSTNINHSPEAASTSDQSPQARSTIDRTFLFGSR